MNSIFKIKGHRILALSVCLILSSFGCVPGANIKVSVRNPVKPAMSVENVQVVNNQIIITGTNLNDVSNFKIVNGATITNLQIESKSTTSIVANTLNNVTFAAGVMFDFVLSTASATSTFQVTFTTANNSITATMLTSMGATKGQIMKYNGFAWTPSSITNAQTYLGTWNAGTNTPDLTSPSSTPGDYFIVSVAGTLNAINYAIGDWIISDGYNWQKVANSAVVVSTFNGRRGIVTMVPGDYVYLLNGSFKLPGSTLNDIANVDLTTVAPANNDVLKYNFATGKWIPGTVAGGGGAGTVTSVTSATTDIGVATGTVTPVLTLNSGTSANQIVKLNGTAQLPALDGSLVTLLNPSNLSAAVPVAKGGTGLSAGNSGGIPYYSSNTAMSSSAVLDLNGVVLGGGAGATPTSTAAGVADQVLRIPGAGGAPAFGAIDLTKAAAVSGALPIANGGTGATSAATARTALGVASGATYATGSTVGTIPLLGTGGIVGSNICTGDNAGGIICTPVTSSVLSASVSDESGAGALLFGTAPTITDPIIANISPAANFTLTQNAVVPFTSISSGAVVNTLYLKAGQVGVGTTTPGSSLDVKGTLRLSGSGSGYVGFAPAAAAGSTTYTLPIVQGTAGQVLTTDGVASTPTLSWATVAVGGGGTVTSVTSSTSDISVATTTSTPVITLNTVPVTKGGTGLIAGTSGGIPFYDSTSTMATSALLGLNSIVLGGGAGATPATMGDGVAGQILTSGGATVAPAWITALPIANGGTGAITAPLARTALGIASGGTYAVGSTTGTIPLLGTLGIVGSNICTGDNAGGIICSPMTSSIVAGSVSDETGSGVMVFGASPTITDPIIANIAPAANFTLTQNAVVPFTSESASAVANTLYLKAGKVGIGTDNPGANLEINGSSGSTLKIVDGNQAAGKFLTSDANGQASWATSASSQWTTATNDIYYSTGKIGMGVSSPVARLDILGENSALIAPLALKVIGGNTTGTGTGGGVSLQAGTASTGAQTGGSSTLTGAANTGVAGVATLAAGNGDNGYAGGNVTLTAGTGTASGTGGVLVVNGGTYGGGNGVGGNIVLNGGAKSGTGTNGNIILANTRGYVGIGNPSPANALDVIGKINATTTATSGNVLTGINTVTGVNTTIGVYGSSAGDGGGSAGVSGVASGTGYIYGVRGYASSANGGSYATAVYGSTEGGSGAGVVGMANATSASYVSKGGSFEANSPVSFGAFARNNAASGNAVALYASSPNSATGYAVYAAVGQNYFAGKVGIGMLSPVYTLDVTGDINSSTCVRSGGTTVGGSCTSDIRLKENIQDYRVGLTELLGFRPRSYVFNGLGEMPKTGELAIGFIAQEVEKYSPDLIGKRKVILHPGDAEKTEIKTVNYSKFIYVVINAIKEFYKLWFTDSQDIHRKIATLEKENNAIKVQNKMMKDFLCKKNSQELFCK